MITLSKISINTIRGHYESDVIDTSNGLVIAKAHAYKNGRFIRKTVGYHIVNVRTGEVIISLENLREIRKVMQAFLDIPGIDWTKELTAELSKSVRVIYERAMRGYYATHNPQLFPKFKV